MYQFLILTIIVILSFQVLPVALALDIKREPAKTVWFALLLLLGQLLLFLAGYYLGARFMHLLEDFLSTVIFIGFFLVGIRFIIDAFKVRKGERTYVPDDSMTVILASLAQAINTFLAGVLSSSLTVDVNRLLFVLFIGCTLIIALGIVMKPQQQSYTFASLLYFIGGIVLIIGSIYLDFFIR